MSVSPLHLITNFNSYVSGEVMIDPNAAIASGVMLIATPNSRINICAGVCIGMGAVLHAHDGTLEIETGAILGAGVLVVGAGKIGANACIGSATTILNCSIERGQIVAPGSLLGDTSRSNAQPQSTNHTQPERGQLVAPGSRQEDTSGSNAQPQSTNTEALDTDSPSQSELESEQIQPQPESAPTTATPVVYGKASLSQLISTLLPYNRSLSQQGQDGSSPPEST